MSRVFSWFRGKDNLSIEKTSRKDFIESLIVHKREKEYLSYLRQKEYDTICIDAFFRLLPTILDEIYMFDIFNLIIKKSRLTSVQLSSIVVSQLSRSILHKDFELCKKILHLPFQSLRISLSTYEIVQFTHTCSDLDQLIECLSILIQKNLPYDSDYLTWILIILFEHYTTGDEKIIEYLLKLEKHPNLLFTCYGNNNVTALMLFFHLYSNDKCQSLIDQYLSNNVDQSVLLQCDTWNRSYLMHLLCGQCQHEPCANSCDIISDDISQINKKVFSLCPHASSVLSKFAMLHTIGNKCDTPIKTILSSQYCLPLRITLFNYLVENNSSFELKFDEFFKYFPSISVPFYQNYLKRLVHNHNLNTTLFSLIAERRHGDNDNFHTIKFLLKQGARINNMSDVSPMLINLISYTHSMIPFTMLDYSLYIDVPFDIHSIRYVPRMNLYVCRLIQCSYPSEFRARFEEFKSLLSETTVKLMDKFIDLKKPQNLTKLCLQKLRSSLRNVGDETEGKIETYLPNRLRQSIRKLGHDECRSYFRSVLLS